ncbi:hypothetical protein FKP32DRAFT_1532302, partial [Trametes sanguinea]
MIRNSNLAGFKIPGVEEAIKATLFADDTTAYLAEADDFAELQQILNTWCSAAKAKFNISKTEVIPIGSKAFRAKMIQEYSSPDGWRNYPRNAKVARDGSAVRILGAYLGNNVDQEEVWERTVRKVEKAMGRWQVAHTTFEGKRHVVQMVVGSMTQFAAHVQRMPARVTKHLTKIIRDYIWDDRPVAPVAMAHLQLHPDNGGLGILDLSARNEAIDVMWTKAYLNFGEGRATWAF